MNLGLVTQRLSAKRLRLTSLYSILLVAAFAALGAPGAGAQLVGKTPPCCTYYVSSTGDDGNSGLWPVFAWRSITRVNQQFLRPGDRVLFEADSVFPGTIVLEPGESGTPVAPITFGSYGPGMGVIWADGNTGFDLIDPSGIRIMNLHVSGSGRDTNNGIGISCYTQLPGDVKLPSIHILGCRVSGFRRGGISIGSWNGRTGFEDVSVEYCRLDNNGNNGMAVWGQYSTTWGQTLADYPHRSIYIGHNVFESNWGDPQRTNKSTGSGCEVAQATLVLIEYNEAFDNGRLNTYPFGGPVGIWMWDVRWGVIQFNESHHNSSSTLDGIGFDLDGGCANCTMQYNYSHDNDSTGFLVAQFPNGARPMKNVTVRYNVSERDGGRGGAGAMQIWNGDSVGPLITSAAFYNNTVYVEAKPLGIPRAFRAFGTGDVALTGFSNNIFISAGTSVWLGEITLVPPPYLVSNLYFADGGPFVVKEGGITYSSLVAWRLGTGHEIYQGLPTGYEGDPLLTSPGNGGTIGNPDALESLSAYRLLANSPYQDLGFPLTSIGFAVGTQDYYGTALFQGTGPSIGAHEGL